MNRKALQNTALIVFIALFLADAINVDELFGVSSIQHDDETSVVDQSAVSILSGSGILTPPAGYSNLPRTSGKFKLELIDVDSPSLEAAYISRDEIAPLILAGESPSTLASEHPEPSFYSLCKLQI